MIRRVIDCAHCEALNVLVNQGLPALLLLAAAILLIAGVMLFVLLQSEKERESA